MKRFLSFIAIFVLITVVFYSCSKWACSCVATGYVSESTLNAALSEHIYDCVSIAEDGPLYDSYYNVTITCSY